MTEPSNNPDARLERLLRQWGADEAVKKTDLPPLPPGKEFNRRAAASVTGTWLMRWAPTLVAAMVLTVAGAVFYVAMEAETESARLSSRGAYGSDASSLDAGNEVDRKVDTTRMKEQLAQTRRELDELRRRMGQDGLGSARPRRRSLRPMEQDRSPSAARGSAGLEAVPAPGVTDDAPARPMSPPSPREAGNQDRAEGARDALDLKLDTAREENRVLRGRLAASDEALGQVQTNVEKLRIEKARLEDRVAELSKLADQVAQLRGEVAEAKRGMALATRAKGADRPAGGATTDAQDDADTANMALGREQLRGVDLERREELLARVKALEGKTQRLQEAFGVAYRLAAGAGRDGLAGWQIAAVRAELAKRAAQVRPSAANEKTRKLIDRIEFVLLRLEQIDPTDAAGRRKLVDIIDKGQLVKLIDARLAAEAEPRNVQSWLLEARAVLEGISDVG